ncbi:MAG: S8 family serine peptidase, partial [Caldilineaceae bacterium]
GAKASRLDAVLAEIAFTAQSRQTDRLALAESLARRGDLRLVDRRVQVQVILPADARGPVTAAVEQAGGTVTGGMADGTSHLLQVWLPLDALAPLAARPDVYYLRRAAGLSLFAETQENIHSEALPALNGPAWQASGRTGEGVRVGVIDGGFSGYRALLGSELPGQVDTANFVDEESAEAVDGTTRHGAAVAEIVHDIAPDARLFLAKIDTNVDLHEAAAWLIQQGVDVIVTSIGWYNLTPGDGTGSFADLVKTAQDAGVLWVTAAGNDRERHWGGLYADPDNDRYHNFSPTQEVNFFGPGDGSTYLIPSGLAVNIHVRWDDWLTVRADYDLYLLRWTGNAWETVASSSNPQSGQAGQTPTETIRFVTDGPPAAYGFVLYQHSGSPTQPINFEVFVPRFLRPSLTVAARSLPNLADAPDALTVAAVNAFNPYAHQSYSSEGPTNGPGGRASGGQAKPDLAAYTNVATASYGALDPFSGTSAAAPHVAGAAALVKQAYPQASPAEIRAFLQGRALDVGAAGRDTQTGVGRLWLGTPPANLVGSSMGVAAPRLGPGAPVTYTIRLVNSGGVT